MGVIITFYRQEMFSGNWQSKCLKMQANVSNVEEGRVLGIQIFGILPLHLQRKNFEETGVFFTSFPLKGPFSYF